ncbi:hypothetical protein IAT38_000937 [Cryptococcus sp. DSM 104549]
MSSQASALAGTPAVPSPALFSLSGQTALITGGSRGIGASIALSLAQAGANIILAQRDVSNTSTKDVISKSAQGVKSEIIKCDLNDLEDVKETFGRALKVADGWGTGGVEILVNCGGMLKRDDTVDVGLDDWNLVLNVNLNSLFILSQAAGKHMIARGGGSILNIASLNSFIGGYRVASYSAAKGAVIQLTKALSNEWSKYNVRVNAIAPGSIATDINTEARKDDAFVKARLAGTPGNRWGAVEDFAGPALFLCSPASQFITGETLTVDGGAMAKGPI